MVNVNLRDFPDELHHKAKIQAAVEAISLKGLIVKALAEYLERAKCPEKTKRG